MPSILLVDENEMIRASMETMLNKEGYHVVAARNGAEAIHCLGLINYDLVITDMVMAKISGLDLAKHIKNDPRLSKVSIIIISSLKDERSKLESLNLGVDEYLAKPIMPFDFLLRVKKLVANKSY